MFMMMWIETYHHPRNGMIHPRASPFALVDVEPLRSVLLEWSGLDSSGEKIHRGVWEC